MLAFARPGWASGQSNFVERHIFHSVTSAGVATVDITNTDIDWLYWDTIVIRARRLTVVTDDVEIRGRVYDTTAATWRTTTYNWVAQNNNRSAVTGNNETASTVSSGLSLTGEVAVGEGVGNAANEIFTTTVIIHDPSDTTEVKMVEWESGWSNASSNIVMSRGWGAYVGGVSAISGFRFLTSSGNIDGAVIDAWGLRNK